MAETRAKEGRQMHYEEIEARHKSGMAMLLLNILLMLASLGGFIWSIIIIEDGIHSTLGIVMLIVSLLYLFFVGPILFVGLKVLKPNEALVLTLFGKYYGTLRGAGFFFVNPFTTATNPAARVTVMSSGLITPEKPAVPAQASQSQLSSAFKKISLKTMTLNNEKQKINDLLGNPIIIGIVVIWRVVNTAKAVFNVDNYKEYLSIQCDSALRNIVRLYPYDISGDNDNEKSLRGSSQEIADRLKDEIQRKVEIAGLEIIEARITHLAYAPEIAAAMLQRQQATAIIDARQMIVEGAVGMVEMALAKLNENKIVNLDEERKAAMVSNLLVVLCGNKDAQPIVNSGSIY
jgi:regulator of protease activity HflC (stomatin/prohibitin superfamily)